MSKTDFSPAKKALGQNFLHDQQIIQKIIAALNPKVGDLVVEIGPGRGALTEHLIKSGCDLNLIEYDHALADYWRERSENLESLSVRNENVLKTDFDSFLAGDDREQLRVIGNLPYNISSQILISLLNHLDKISDIVAMLQLEMVDRICAQPDTKTYGRLTVMLQQAFRCEKLFKVPGGAFTPAPKVESAIIRLTPIEDEELTLVDQTVFADIVKQAFAQRRKTLNNNLKKIVPAELFVELDIDPKLRPENIRVKEYVRLANALAKRTD